MLPTAIYIFNIIPIKTPHFHRAGTNNPKICMKPEKTPNRQRNVEKENQSWWHHNSRLQAILQAVIIKSEWQWHKNRHTVQWNRIGNSEMDLQLNDQLIFNKAGENIQWKKDSLFNKWCWENWTATYRRMKRDHLLTPYTKINSKWIKVLNVRQEFIKILAENTGSNHFDLGCSTSC